MPAAAQKSEWTKFPSPEIAEENFTQLIVELPRLEPRLNDSYHKILTNYLKQGRDRSIFKDKAWQKSSFVKPIDDTLATTQLSKVKHQMSEIDAKIAASEARTDTKFAEMMGELRLINQRLEHVENSTSGLRMNTWLAAATAVALVVAIFSWGSSMFGVGMDAQSIANQSAKSLLDQAEPRFSSMNANFERLDKNYEALQTQIGIILTAVEAQKKNTPSIKPAPEQK